MPKLIILYGEEDFLVERAARDEALIHVPDEVLEYRMPEGLDDYLCESQTPLIASGRRAFILWGADSVPSLPESDDDVLIVAGGKKPLSHPAAARTLRFDKLKAYDDNNEVVRWILKEGERFKIDLTRVAGALFVSSGNSLRKLASEITKLAAVTPSGSVVDPVDARSVMCFSAELTPRQVVDSICEGHVAKALAFYDRLQERNDETGWIIAYMQRHVLQSLQAGALLGSGVPVDRAASIVGIHPFIFCRAFTTPVWERASLVRSLGSLCDLDALHKRGVDVRCGLELEIITLSEEAYVQRSPSVGRVDSQERPGQRGPGRG